MNIDSLSVYVGPNVHAREAVIRLKVDVKPSYAESLKGLGADGDQQGFWKAVRERTERGGALHEVDLVERDDDRDLRLVNVVIRYLVANVSAWLLHAR
jgi:hypothetical protein